MKPNASMPRRTALAIAAASAGLTLAVTATLAGSLGWIAPAVSPATTSGPATQLDQPKPEPGATDVPAVVPSGPTDLVASSGAPSPPAEPAASRRAATGDTRLARRERDDRDDNDNEGERTERRRPSGTTWASGSGNERSASRVVSRARHEDDDDDD